MSQAPHIALYTDYRAMLQQESLDAVFISSPNAVHAQQAIAALSAGVHVFLEKPMGITPKESLRKRGERIPLPLSNPSQTKPRRCRGPQ